MKHNARQLNWILGEIEQTGYIQFDDIRDYYNDGKLSAKHLAAAKKSVNFLIKAGWIKKRKGRLVFTKLGRVSWGFAGNARFIKTMIEKEFKFLVAGWDVGKRKD